MNPVQLVESPIELSQWEKSLQDVDSGAHVWFAGVTRRKTKASDGQIRITATLHYEAHPTMAVKELQQLADQAKDKFGLLKVVIVHRLGEVPLGQASVLVGCCSAHRKDAFLALPWIMDRLKEDVPIWKRETYEDQQTEWIHP